MKYEENPCDLVRPITSPGRSKVSSKQKIEDPVEDTDVNRPQQLQLTAEGCASVIHEVEG